MIHRSILLAAFALFSLPHYVADKPEGPFRFRDVALAGTGEETWDWCSAHNPEVRYYEGKFVLLYVSNSDYHQPPHPLNQRIGMATAPSPDGPWTRGGGGGRAPSRVLGRPHLPLL